MPEFVQPRNVLLADSSTLFREAVSAVLQREPDLDVVAAVGDGRSVTTEILRVRPDIAVIDAAMPGIDGLELTRLVCLHYPSCRVLVVSESEDESVLVESMKVGASGYLTKQYPIDDLLDGIRTVCRGDTVVPSRMLRGLLDRLIDQATRHEDALRRIARLTQREREVLSLLSRGGTNQTIARDLVISPHTARTHIQNTLTKLGFRSRLQAAMFVTRNGVLSELAVVGS
jgi:DNA-binding NarL/FixJ family response regulator